MKQLVVLTGCCIILSGLTGCQSADSGVEANIEGGEFPEFLVGRWKADTGKRQITLGTDGSVISAVNEGGMTMVMAEGGLAQPGRGEGTFLYFVYGPCYADYNPARRELSVTITIDYLRMEVPGGALEGKMKDCFTGPVSRDGKKWNAKLITTGSLIGQELTDPNLIIPESLIFKKVD